MSLPTTAPAKVPEGRPAQPPGAPAKGQGGPAKSFQDPFYAARA
jgi:hypothetical protein